MDGFPRGLHLLLPQRFSISLRSEGNGFGAASRSYEEREGGGRRENTGVCEREPRLLLFVPKLARRALPSSHWCQPMTSGPHSGHAVICPVLIQLIKSHQLFYKPPAGEPPGAICYCSAML